MTAVGPATGVQSADEGSVGAAPPPTSVNSSRRVRRSATWHERFIDARRAPLAPLTGLVVVALLWGGSFVVVKSAVAEVSPPTLVAWRFTIAAAVVFVSKPGCLRGVRARTVLQAGVLGVLFGTGFLLQSWGMQSTSVVLSAFTARSSVVIVPLIACIWFRRRLNASTGYALALVTVGLALISMRGDILGVGELPTLAATALWAGHLVALERWSRNNDVTAIAAIQLAVVAALAWGVLALLPASSAIPSSTSAWSAIALLGVLGTAIPLVPLTHAQTKVNATMSAVVLTLEPISGAIIAITLGGETSSSLLLLLLGATAVVSAVLIAAHTTGVQADARSHHSVSGRRSRRGSMRTVAMRTRFSGDTVAPGMF